MMSTIWRLKNGSGSLELSEDGYLVVTGPDGAQVGVYFSNSSRDQLQAMVEGVEDVMCKLFPRERRRGVVDAAFDDIADGRPTGDG